MKFVKRIGEGVKKEVRETKVLLSKVPALLMTFFVLSVVMMNLLANKSLDLHADWIALDAGITVSWMAFLTLDILVKVFGPKAATRMSLVATGMNIIVALLFAGVAAIPGIWSQSYLGEVVNEAIDNTIAGTWYVIAGSTVAFIVSALVNNVLNWLIGKAAKNSKGFVEYAFRSYVSTFVAQFVDNLVFSLLVSLRFFGWNILQCFTCALTGAVVELLFEVLFSPFGYKIAKNLKEGRASE